ncbi:hypothetical protein MJ584_15880 [Klebsiella pneumoniae]|nr:hypothetical protein MJ584_15880 [Klebsiella pneumoniae]
MDKQYPVRQAHGADLVVSQLEAQGVRQVFGIPGAKIDKVFDSPLIPPFALFRVRHEANAAFGGRRRRTCHRQRAWRWSPPVRVVLT